MAISYNTLLHADALVALKELPANSFNSLITDPPYSSGGLHRGDRSKDSKVKYLDKDTIYEYANHSFDGDNLDQRAWTSWTAEWLSLARNTVKPGGVAAVFTDWRQIGALIDAIQWAGWTWRGVLAWDKRNARPQIGRPKQQCEFIVWASNGALPVRRNAPFLPGLFSYAPPYGEKRLHQTEKPLGLMRELVHICEVDGAILDPFAGSGTTLVAAKMEGYKYFGIEKDDYYFDIADKRIAELLESRQDGYGYERL